MVQFDINRVVPQGEARGTIPTILAADTEYRFILVTRTFTDTTGVTRVDMPFHQDLLWNDFDLFTHIFADPGQFSTAAAALLFLRNIMENILPRNTRINGFTTAFLASI